MKKIEKIIVYLAICICLIMTAVFYQKGNKKEEQRPINSTEKNTSDNTSQSDETQNDMSNEKKEKKLTYQTLSYELLGCEIIDDVDIENQDKYKAEFFVANRLPSLDDKVVFVDRPAIKDVCPELKDLWENSNKYSLEESQEIFEAHIDVINEYTYEVHPKTHYVFVKCKIKNMADKAVNVPVFLCVYKPFADQDLLWMGDVLCYFDKAVNTDANTRSHSFFFYNFEPNEELECVIGFEVAEELNSEYNVIEEYYIGAPCEEDYPTFSNTELIKVDDLDEIDN